MYSIRLRHIAACAILALLACAQPARATQTLDAQITDTCAPWDGAAAEIHAPLPNGKIFVAHIWQPAGLAAGLTLDNKNPDDSTSPGNSTLCPDSDHTQFRDCKPAGSRININDADPKGGDTGSGTLYIEDMGTFLLNVHWTHTPQFCG